MVCWIIISFCRMAQSRPIGGYFELELRKGEHYHKNAIRLNTARNCFEYVLRTRHIKKVYIPYYTCEVMLEPVVKLGIDYKFYHIDESLEPATLPDLKANEAFLYTNYFGLKQSCVIRLKNVYGNRLIVDNAQAFYAKPLPGIDTFYSPRKFFGVPDGAYLYSDMTLQQELEQDNSFDRMSHLLKRVDLGAEAGYQDFKKNDNALVGKGVQRMSRLTDVLLSGIDYKKAKTTRRENFNALDKVLSKTNRFHFDLDEDNTPMVYPYFINDKNLKQRLIAKKIFVATYWPNVYEWCKPEDWEFILAESVAYIPLDQRYDINDMTYIISVLKEV